MVQLRKNDKLFYTRIIPRTRIYEVCELIVRTVEDTWFVAIDKRDKHAYLFTYDDVESILFEDREKALSIVLDAEKKSPKIKSEEDEIDYEEY